MTTSLNGRVHDRVPLAEIPLEDPLVRQDRAIMHTLAEVEAKLDRMDVELAAIERRARVRRWTDPGELLRWAACIWLLVYGVIVLVGVFRSLW